MEPRVIIKRRQEVPTRREREKEKRYCVEISVRSSAIIYRTSLMQGL